MEEHKHYLIPDQEKSDVIPELWEGHTVADFVDPDIREDSRKERFVEITIKLGNLVQNPNCLALLKRSCSVSRLRQEFGELGVVIDKMPTTTMLGLVVWPVKIVKAGLIIEH
ncbi:hypothetical protein JTE90_006138 [Oedothorax gibbosus]|uniref:NOG C-terminal domain-containing protein n=1 Tax=Oedothorax gibbosus TaxID=931172 RepID=A0AAV6V3Q1_9ARAC|nr:hypothetical protein JTE90_006138 [Oedothorax gibbosus]